MTTNCKEPRLKQITSINRAETREYDEPIAASIRSSNRGHGDVSERVIRHTRLLRLHGIPQGFDYTHFSGFITTRCMRKSQQTSRELHSVATSTHISKRWDGVHTLIGTIFYPFNYQLEIHFHLLKILTVASCNKTRLMRQCSNQCRVRK